MFMLRIVILATMLAAVVPAHASEVFLVNRAQDMRFVPLKDAFVAIRSRIEGHVDLMDRLRRAAFKRMSDEWGIPPADKNTVEVGCVARTDTAGHLSYAIVLRGDIDPQKIQAKLLALNDRDAKLRGVGTHQEKVDAGGHPAMRFPYFEREMEFTLVPLDKMFVLNAAPKSDTVLLDEVLSALKDPSKLGQAPLPGAVVVDGHIKLTDRERKRVTDFQARASTSKVAKIRDRFRQLQDTLRPGGAKDEDLISLDERMNQQFLKATDYELKVSYQPGDRDFYRGKYVLTFATPEDATRMRELLLEKALFFRDNASNQAIPRALDSVTVDAQGPATTVRVELDTPDKRYDAAFSYLAFLLSFNTADADLGVAR